ncbi:MAG: hypothetical protein HKO93_03170 [Flavobacteriales bacterium]|nr:hypothetical protein [Flavobacteriales bacterium]
MIKFFRHIRKRMLKENRFTRYTLYAIGEIVLVVIGILIALQINNWNEDRKAHFQEVEILNNLRTDLQADFKELSYQIASKKKMVLEYRNCLEILSENKEGSIEELKRDLKSIFQVGGLSLNKTTFNNLETTGEIRLIRNKALADSIVAFYNSGYEGWETALRDYTRNITAPYFLSFDHITGFSFTDDDGTIRTMPFNPSDFSKPGRTLEEYRQDYFIINTLRQKTWNLEALIDKYQGLQLYVERLDRGIEHYLDSP